MDNNDSNKQLDEDIDQAKIELQEKAGEVLPKFAIMIVSLIISLVINPIIWRWGFNSFLADVFNLSHITFWQAFGLSLFVDYAIWTPIKENLDLDTSTQYKMLISSIGTIIITVFGFLLAGLFV